MAGNEIATVRPLNVVEEIIPRDPFDERFSETKSLQDPSHTQHIAEARSVDGRPDLASSTPEKIGTKQSNFQELFSVDGSHAARAIGSVCTR